MRGVVIGLAAVAAVAVARPAVAQDAASKLQACRGESSDIRRLACFDRAFAAATRGAPPAASSSAAPPGPSSSAAPSGPLDLTIPDGQTGWLVRRGRAPLDGSPIVAAILQAKQARIARLVSGRLPQQAALVIICRDHKTDLYIGYSDIVDGMGPVPVRYQVGDSPPVEGQWEKSQDFMSYGIWHTAKTVPFILSLVNAPTFSIRADPGPMGVSEASFDLGGMGEAIGPVREACGW